MYTHKVASRGRIPVADLFRLIMNHSLALAPTDTINQESSVSNRYRSLLTAGLVAAVTAAVVVIWTKARTNGNYKKSSVIKLQRSRSFEFLTTIFRQHQQQLVPSFLSFLTLQHPYQFFIRFIAHYTCLKCPVWWRAHCVHGCCHWRERNPRIAMDWT